MTFWKKNWHDLEDFQVSRYPKIVTALYINFISASERSTELNNHFKMFRSFTLWGTNHGFKVLRPSVFELWATPFFGPTILAEI